MIVARFKVQCRPERTEEMGAAIAAVEAPSREIPGVVHFDAARSACSGESASTGVRRGRSPLSAPWRPGSSPSGHPGRCGQGAWTTGS